jgi:hypothetical protein
MTFFKSKIMKTLKNLLFAASVCLAIVSCSKTEDETNPSEFPFAEESVDQGKTNISAAGQEVLYHLAALDTVDAMVVIQSLENCLSKNNPFSTAVSNVPVFSTISAVANIGADKNSFSYLTKAMQTDIVKDTTLSQLYKKYIGIYTWNATTSKWVKTASSTNFQFIFPSKKGNKTNGSTLSFTYTGKSGFSYNNYNGDLPTAFNISIETNKAKVFEMDFKASYNSDFLPTSVNYFVSLTPFKFDLSYDYSSSNISTRAKFSNASKTIIEFYFTTSGQYGMDDIDKADKVYDVVNNASAYFQVLNIKLAGDLNVDKAVKINDSINHFTSLQLKNNANRLAKELNDCVNLNLVYADSKEKIASLEIYSEINQDNSNVEFKYRFIFSDGSKGDLEDYFGTGFRDLMESASKFASRKS